jgi:sulfopyruvate decarboxylase TPP-binding subunit
MSWSDILLRILKDNDIRLIAYVPDNVLTPLIAGVGADNYFLPVSATREDEAIGTATGAYMAGLARRFLRAWASLPFPALLARRMGIPDCLG